MEVQFYERAEELLEAASAAFATEPFTTNVIGVVASATAERRRPAGERDVWATVGRPGGAAGVAGVAMQTPPWNLFVSRMPAEYARSLAVAIAGGGRALPGVTGEVGTVRAFVEAWAGLTGSMPERQASIRLYRLGELEPPRGVPGSARPARVEEAELVVNWAHAFHLEAAPGRAQDDAEATRRRVASGDMSLWLVEGKPVCSAGCSAPAGGVARIGPVYTPPEHRRRGYASALTAALCLGARAAGATEVVLYADLANPTSNSICQAIGFVPDHDAEEWRFA